MKTSQTEQMPEINDRKMAPEKPKKVDQANQL